MPEYEQLLVDQLPLLREQIRRLLREFNPEADGLTMNHAAGRLLAAVHAYDGAEIVLRRLEVDARERING